jgi:phosphatidate cytidylyltransferase
LHAAAVEDVAGWYLTLAALVMLVHTAWLLRSHEIETGAHRLAACAILWLFAVVLGFLIDVGAAFGTPVLFAVVLTTKAGDIGAYLTGRFLGRHKLIPHISPNKTVEGAIGGVVLGLVTGVVLLSWLGEGRWSLLAALLAAAAITVGGILGDLVESLLKRAAGIKDSGSLVPEFGGALDMLDSLFLAAPIGFGLLLVLQS